MNISPAPKRFSVDELSREKVNRAARILPSHWQWRLFTLGLLISDITLIGIAFRAAYFIRFDLQIPLFQLEVVPELSYYRVLVFWMIPLWTLLFALLGLYSRQNLLGGTKEYSLVFNASIIGMLIVITAGFFGQTIVFARGWLFLAWFCSFLFVDMGRFIYRRVIYALRRRGYFLMMGIIVGANNEGVSLAEQLIRWNYSGLKIIGFVDKKISVGTPVFHDLNVLGSVDDLAAIVKENNVEEIILASSAITSRDKLVEIFMRYSFEEGVNVRMSSGLYEILTTGLTIKEFAYVPLVGVNPARLTGVDQVFKFILDYSLTIPGIVLISPLLLLIAVLIKLDSPGPVIHRRCVMGMNGARFTAFKFRTMYVNGDQILENHPGLKDALAEDHKLKNDPRVTRIGDFLRKTSLDELPQIFNVLRREMSLVGPRMISPEETRKYEKLETNLLTVRPGITGLWQVSGRSDVTYEERVRLDMYYIRNWSIWMDIRLLIDTIPAVIRRRGAY